MIPLCGQLCILASVQQMPAQHTSNMTTKDVSGHCRMFVFNCLRHLGFMAPNDFPFPPSEHSSVLSVHPPADPGPQHTVEGFAGCCSHLTCVVTSWALTVRGCAGIASVWHRGEERVELKGSLPAGPPLASVHATQDVVPSPE